MEEMNRIDRKLLIRRLSENLQEILQNVNLTQEQLAKRAGVSKAVFDGMREGTSQEDSNLCLTWSEYLSVIFVLWSKEDGRNEVEARGLFPPALKEAFSVDRTVH